MTWASHPALFVHIFQFSTYPSTPLFIYPSIHVRSFYFDGKHIATLALAKGKSGKTFQKTEIQDHYVILEEPNSVYLGHVVPYSGHGICIAVALSRFAKAHGWDPHITVVGADGTKTNVGSNNRAIPYFKKLLGHSLHWNICSLHANKLPFQALFAHYDGKTAGPTSFKGPIGKEL